MTVRAWTTVPLRPSPLAAMAAFVILIQLAWWLQSDSIIAIGDLNDGDSYARLVRVTRLYETGGWFDGSFPRANAPYGDTLHWTRLFDILLLALALPLAPLLGFAKGLYFAGVIISPLLHVLTALALAWAIKPIMGRMAAYVAGGLTAAQFGVLGVATAGHADHHILFALISVLAFGFAIRSFNGQKEWNKAAFAAGAMLALGFWAGAEVIVFLAICLTAAGLPWLLGEPNAAQRNFHLCLGLALFLALVLLAERGPSDYLQVEYDRVSIIQLAMAVLLMAFWGAVVVLCKFWESKGMLARLTASMFGIIIIAAVMRLLFPKILQGPMADVDQGVMFLINDILESAPIGDVWHFLIYAGSAIFALPFALWRIREEWPGPARWPFVLSVLALLVYLAFAVNWVRWSLYAGIFLTVFLAGLIVRVDEIAAKLKADLPRILVKTLAILLLSVGPLGVGIAGAHGQEKAKASARKESCVLKEMAKYLNLSMWSDRPRTIIASVNFGTELLYRTPHLVLATLYHRNSQGIIDSVKILGGDDDALSLRLVRERKVDLLLLCPKSGHDYYFTEQNGELSLYHRLVNGVAPSWLKEASLPQNLETQFRLFEVIPSSSPE